MFIHQTVRRNRSEFKIGVKPGAIEILLGKGNVSVYRKRLYEKLTKKEGAAKDFDKYISDI